MNREGILGIQSKLKNKRLWWKNVTEIFLWLKKTSETLPDVELLMLAWKLHPALLFFIIIIDLMSWRFFYSTRWWNWWLHGTFLSYQCKTSQTIFKQKSFIPWRPVTHQWEGMEGHPYRNSPTTGGLLHNSKQREWLHLIQFFFFNVYFSNIARFNLSWVLDAKCQQCLLTDMPNCCRAIPMTSVVLSMLLTTSVLAWWEHYGNMHQKCCRSYELPENVIKYNKKKEKNHTYAQFPMSFANIFRGMVLGSSFFFPSLIRLIGGEGQSKGGDVKERSQN